MSKSFRHFLAAVALCLSPAFASAGIITFDFDSWGVATPIGSCGLLCYEIQTQGTVIEIGSDDVPGTQSWSLSGLMQFLQVGNLFGIGTGQTSLGGGWSFTDTTGGNSLFGSFTMLLEGGADDSSRLGSVQYIVEGGTGLFDQAIGTGLSIISLEREGSLFSFFERGLMSVLISGNGSVQVPEPGVLALFAAAAFGLFLAMRRRRSAVRVR